MTLNDNNLHIAAACADLLFSARVRAAGEAAGRKVRLLARSDDMLARLSAEPPALLLLDLDADWLDAPALIAALRGEPATAGVRIVAFGSHVRTEALAAARAAGADRVLARSAFVRELPRLLAEA